MKDQNAKFEVQELTNNHIILKYAGHDIHVMHWGLNVKTGRFGIAIYEDGNDSDTPNDSAIFRVEGD